RAVRRGERSRSGRPIAISGAMAPRSGASLTTPRAAGHNPRLPTPAFTPDRCTGARAIRPPRRHPPVLHMNQIEIELDVHRFIFQTAAKLRSATDPDKVLRYFLRATAELMQAERACIAVLEV